ncbi:MAG: AMP-binding protein [Actinomycetia bacterium]|nr:AMP-binding protein [Actinomycetes bacterium]
MTFSAVFHTHAEARGDRPAVTLDDGQVLSFADLNIRATCMAHHMIELGAGNGSFITIAAPNSFQFVIACLAAWRIGAIPQPVSSRLPTAELDAIVELADPAVVVGTERDDRPFITEATTIPPKYDPLPDVAGPSWKAPTSGGSTGRPKLIVAGDPAIYGEGLERRAEMIGAEPGETMVMPGPLYHNGPFIWMWGALLVGGHIALLHRFDAEKTLETIERTTATSVYLVPTMMQRMWKLPDDIKFSYDLSSMRKAFHLAEPCPKWLKEAWIDWIGPENLWELYGGTEGQAATTISGVEWLEHPGSVGRPAAGAMKVCGEDGDDLPPGEVGEVWMRPVGRDTPTYRYIGAEAETRDGWDCLGDIGWIDEDGFLYLADRRADMILVGGANVFPAEVEAAINLHPGVASSAVIGLPDDEKGNRIHAIVQPTTRPDPLAENELVSHLAEHLVAYKLPRSFEFVEEPLRDDAGKVRRAELRNKRLNPT